ncbi:Protein O-mannosyl-transferase 2, partial [Fragariocoptes setiger]
MEDKPGQTLNTSQVKAKTKPRRPESLTLRNGTFNFMSISSERLLFVVMIGAAVASRFYRIDEPSHVCWDETHFGKMASWYINRTFFFDVHPPLGKLMIAASGYLSGYNGTFAYNKPGDPYDHWSQYLGMRVFCTFLGFMIVPFTYEAVRSMTQSSWAAVMSATLVLLDNGLTTLTRYILLDPPLLFFISGSFLGMAKTTELLDCGEHFTRRWWFWLLWTGTFIAGAFSVKFVGLFIVATVGLRTAYDLWLLLGDLSRPISYWLKHLTYRVLALIVWPITVYVVIFYIHLAQLNHSGNGDGFYSSAFQSQLIGNSLHNASWPAHLAYGATITLKNNRIGGAYLHSHMHLYPHGIGARQQQVTAYSHKDANNHWLVKRAQDSDTRSSQSNHDDVSYVHDGDLLRLEHVLTRRNLHSHREPAPVTKRHFQVTGYGQNGTGDLNDVWRIVLSDSWRPTVDADLVTRIWTVKSKFRLIHVRTGCALHSHSRQLPKWAYEQLEVTCNPRIHDTNNLWNIEDNVYDRLPNVSFEECAPSFMDRFIESHAVMLQGNAGLKPKEGEVTSRPWQWPLNYKGQFFSASDGKKVYLLGNPVIWWANLATIPLSILTLAAVIVINCRRGTAAMFIEMKKSVSKKYNKFMQTKSVDTQGQHDITFVASVPWMLLAWALHYVPFYFMGRILYFHHYFPAFIFSCMLTATTVDYLIKTLVSTLCNSTDITTHKRLERIIEFLGLTLLAILMYTFVLFAPITYGIMQETVKQTNNETTSNLREEQILASLRWLDSWEF